MYLYKHIDTGKAGAAFGEALKSLFTGEKEDVAPWYGWYLGDRRG